MTLVPLAAAVISSANSGGVRSLAGVFTQSRTAPTAPATTCASSKAVVASARRAAGLSTLTVPAALSGDFER